MPGAIRKVSLGFCLVLAVGLLGASAALAAPQAEVTAVRTPTGLAVTVTNKSTNHENLAGVLIQMNSGFTATACQPSSECAAHGNFTQRDFSPPLEPGESETTQITTDPAPYTGSTIDVIVSVSGDGTLRFDNVPVQGPPSASAVKLPGTEKVDPKSGKAELTVSTEMSHPDENIIDLILNAITPRARLAYPAATRAGLQAPLAAAKSVRVGTLANIRIPAGQQRATTLLRLNAKGRALLKAKRKLKVTVSGKLTSAAGSTNFKRGLTLVAKK